MEVTISINKDPHCEGSLFFYCHFFHLYGKIMSKIKIPPVALAGLVGTLGIYDIYFFAVSHIYFMPAKKECQEPLQKTYKTL